MVSFWQVKQPHVQPLFSESKAQIVRRRVATECSPVYGSYKSLVAKINNPFLGRLYETLQRLAEACREPLFVSTPIAKQVV